MGGTLESNRVIISEIKKTVNQKISETKSLYPLKEQ